MEAIAAVLRAVGRPAPYAGSQPYSIERVTLADPGPNEVLVEIAAAGICHSDLAMVQGAMKRPVPLVGGHEGAGIVRETGIGVTHLKAGDHVVLMGVGSCGACAYCSRGRPQLCDASVAARNRGLLPTGGRRIVCEGETLSHYAGVSAFASHAVCAASSLVRIDGDLPLNQAAILGCAVLTGAGAIFNAAGVRAGDTVAIIGLGGVGLSAVAAAAACGASQIIGIDRNAERLPLASRFGATHTLLGSEADCVDQIRELTVGGADVVLDVVGTQDTFDLALAIGRRGSAIVALAVKASGGTITIPQSDFVRTERSLRGSILGSADPRNDIDRLVALWRAGRLRLADMIEKTRPLDEINQCLDRLAAGDGLRQIVSAHQ